MSRLFVLGQNRTLRKPLVDRCRAVGCYGDSIRCGCAARLRGPEGGVVKVFVAGATGVIGRSLVPLLVRGGHDVVGMTSSAEKVEQSRSVGATAVVCDALDAEAVQRAVVEAAPEAIVHQLTRI